MLSSGDISAMMAAQQQSFMGQAQYAGQIGIDAPSNTLAAWGTPRGSGYGGAAFPGMHGPPAPISYAPTGFAGASYGTGTQLAGNAMSAIGAGATAAGAGLGMLSMFGSMGKMAPFLDPISGGMAGYARFGLMGAGLGAALPLGLAAAAGHTVNAFVHGGQQQQMLNANLGAFNFVNQASRTGVGFTRDDAQAIGQQVRAISHIPEMMTSFEELTRLIPKLKGSGVMQGVRDATEFAARFKDAVKTIRDVSKILGTTMEEASEFFSHSRSVGFLGKQAQLQNAMNLQFTAGTTGMSTGQVMQMQQSGANYATARGIRRSVGARAVTNMAQYLGQMQNEGKIEQGLLEDITGAQGPEAVGAASEMFTQAMGRMAEGTAIGRLSMFALADFDEDGRYRGVNKERARRMQAGSLSVGEMKKIVHGFNRRQKLAVTANIGALSTEFAGMAGPGGIGSVVRNIAKSRGWGEDEMSIILQRQGFSEAQSEAMLQMSGSAFSESDQKAFAERQMQESAISDRTNPSKIWARLKTKMHASTFGHIEALGSSASTYISKAWDSFIDDVVGRHVITMSKEGAKNLKQAFSSNEGRKNLYDMFQAYSGVGQMAAGLDKGPSKFGMLIGNAVMRPLAGFFTGGWSEAATLGYAGFGSLARGREINSFSQATGMDSWGHIADAIVKPLGRAFGRAGSGESSTGRTAAEQWEWLKENYGVRGRRVAGMGEDEKEKFFQDRQQAITNFGRGEEFDEARAHVSRIIAGLDSDGKFSDASEAQKLSMLTDAINKVTGNTTNKGNVALKTAVLKLKGRGLATGGASEGALLATMFGVNAGRRDRIDMSQVGGSQGAAEFQNVATLQKAAQEAEEKLGDSLGKEVTQIFKDKPHIGSAALLAVNGGDDNLATALEGKDDVAALQALRRSSRDNGITPEDLAVARQAYQKLKDKRLNGGKQWDEIQNGIGAFERAKKAGDYSIFNKGIVASASSITGESKLKKALTAFANFKGTGKGEAADKEAFEGHRSSIESEVEDISRRYRKAMSSGDKKGAEAILEEAGDLKDQIRSRADASGKGLVGNHHITGQKALEKLAERLGLGKGGAEMLGKSISADELKGGVTKEIFEKARSIATKAGVGGAIADRTKSETAADKDKEMLDVLKGIKTALSLNATALSLSSITDDTKKAAALKNIEEGVKGLNNS